MKFLLNFLDKQRPKFAKGTKLEKIEPLFEAGDAFLFTSDTVTKKGAHIRDALDLKRLMITVVWGIMPCFLFGVWNAGHQYNLNTAGVDPSIVGDVIRGLIIVLPIVIVSYLVGGFWEVLFACVRKHEINEGLLVTGLLFPLILPPTIPLWQVAVGISFGVVIGKEIFGGTGMNLVNPALMARAFLFFAYAKWMAGDVWIRTGEATIDAYSGATPLGILANLPEGTIAVQALSDAGYSFSSMLIGSMPGSIAETSVIACLFGAIVLLVTGVASWRIMLSSVVGLVGIAALARGMGATGYGALPPYYHLVMGGFAFGAVFMATDPVSAAATNTGKWIYGFLIGALVAVVRIWNPAYPEGVMLSILFMNVMAPMIDNFVVEAHLKRRKKRG